MEQHLFNFTRPVQSPMVRSTDPETSEAAALVVTPHLGKIQALVLEVFQTQGPMTAREAERLDCFADYGFSTIRKRISELAAEGYLMAVSVDKSRKAPATVYGVAG